MATALTGARTKDTEARQFVLKADGTAINLAGVTAVKLHYRQYGASTWTTLSTLDTVPMLAVTNAAQGLVTLTPTATFWQVGVYELYFSVDGTTDYNLKRDENYTVTVVEGA